MEVTEVKVIPVEEERLKAFVTITFDNCFIVRDVKIINGNNGLFVAMPSKKRKDGTFRDVAHPLNHEMRETIEKQVVDKYNEVIAAGPESSSADEAEQKQDDEEPESSGSSESNEEVTQQAISQES